jgi:metal-responsive CopG/Arc/MetJ family transcriptional regulator
MSIVRFSVSLEKKLVAEFDRKIKAERCPNRSKAVGDLIRAGLVQTTHDLHIIEDIADTVYVFGQDRRIAGHGSPAEILADTALHQANNLIHRHSHHARDHWAMRTG